MVELRFFRPSDAELLFAYGEALSETTKKRFAPHSFDKITIRTICEHLPNENACRLVAVLSDDGSIVGYFIGIFGVSANDKLRLTQQGIGVNEDLWVSFAPSIRDDFQQMGLGKLMFDRLLAEVKRKGKQQMVLLGGVQQDNVQAIAYYQKLGFKNAGHFFRGEVLNVTMWRKI